MDNLAKDVQDRINIKEDSEKSTRDVFDTVFNEDGNVSGDKTLKHDSMDKQEKTADIDQEDLLLEKEQHLTQEEKQARKDEALTFKEEGNKLFKDGDNYLAADLYSRALAVCPAAYPDDRAILYANRAAAKLKLDLNEDAISDCSAAIKLNQNYTKAVLRRAGLLERTEKLEEALTDYKHALELEPGNKDAQHACYVLPQKIEERNEKLKAECLGKLKDLGNLVLRPFGLSTDNFKMEQNPETGGYSVNFQQNTSTQPS